MTVCGRGALAVLLLLATSAAAQAPVLTPSPSVVLQLPAAGENVNAVGLRLVAIRTAVAAEVPRLQLWRWSWTATYAALTVGQLVPIPFVEPSTRVDWWVGALSTALGAALEAFVPPDIIADAPRYAEFPATPEGLAAAETLLRHDADNEDFSRSWLFHAGNVVFNAAVGLVLGLGFKHWESAAINFGVGVAVGEAMILTQPHLLADLSRAGGEPHLSVAPFLVAGGGGLAFGGRF